MGAHLINVSYILIFNNKRNERDLLQTLTFTTQRITN